MVGLILRVEYDPSWPIGGTTTTESMPRPIWLRITQKPINPKGKMDNLDADAHLNIFNSTCADIMNSIASLNYKNHKPALVPWQTDTQVLFSTTNSVLNPSVHSILESSTALCDNIFVDKITTLRSQLSNSILCIQCMMLHYVLPSCLSLIWLIWTHVMKLLVT